MATLTVPRMYTDEQGDSRFDTYEVRLDLQDHAPPAASFFAAEPQQATKYVFSKFRQAGWGRSTPRQTIGS